MTEPTELFAIGIDGSRNVYVRNPDGSWPTVPTRVEPVATATVVDAGERWKHVKRGTEYEVIGAALLQDAAGHGVHEGMPLTIYRGDDGMMWARPTNEFHDGRFFRATPTPTAGER